MDVFGDSAREYYYTVSIMGDGGSGYNYVASALGNIFAERVRNGECL